MIGNYFYITLFVRVQSTQIGVIMNNTMKCMKLDLMLLKPYLKSMGLVLLVPLLFPVFIGSLFEGLSFAVTIMAMTTAYTFSIAEKNNLDRFYGFLPIKDKNLVMGRYLAIFIIGLLSLLFEVIAQVLILSLVLSAMPSVQEILESFSICALLFCIYAGFQIPGYYKYGSIKGKVFMFIPTVGFLLIYGVINLLNGNAAVPAVDFLKNTGILVIFAFVLIILIIAASAMMSTKIVKRAKN